MKQNLLLITFFLAMLYAYPQDAQPVTVNSAGGATTIAGDIYEWSFAEMMLVNTATGSNLIVTSGVLQPSAPNVGISEPLAVDIPVYVYPNPTPDLLNLATGFKEPGKLLCQLYDVSGKTLVTERTGITAGDNLTTFSLDQYPAGEYVLKVLFIAANSQTYNRSFKIQKIR